MRDCSSSRDAEWWQLKRSLRNGTFPAPLSILYGNGSWKASRRTGSGRGVDFADSDFVFPGRDGVESEALRAFILDHVPKVESRDLNENALEVLACIAHKQPLCQAEIDRHFATDKRGIVHRLREMELVTEFAGKGGRLEYATTEKFLGRFGMGSLNEMKQINP